MIPRLIRWVIRLAWVLLVGLAESAVAAELRLEFDKREIDRGKPLRGRIVYQGNTDPGAFDLSPWQAQFHVDSGYTEVAEDEPGTVVRRESVRLYPRLPGEQQIPALTHGGVRSAPLAVNVLAPRPEQGELVLTHRVSAERVSAGEQLTVRVRLVTNDDRVRVSIDPIDHGDRSNVSSQVLKPRRELLPDGGGIEYRLGWSLHLAEVGRRRLELPPVRYTLFGRDLYKFHLPLLSVQVDALPAYVPLTVPVGELTLSSAIEERSGTRGWHVVVETDGQLPVGLPELESQLAGLSGVAPEILQKEQRQEVREDAVYTVLEYQAPLPRWLGGLGQGPRLAVQIFDPLSRRIQRQVHELPRAWRFPGWFGVTLLVLGAVLTLLIARGIIRTGSRWQARRALIEAVNSTGDASSLRRLLLADSDCRTLSDWADRWVDAQASVPATSLNAVCFGRARVADLQALKRDVVRVIRRSDSVGAGAAKSAY